MLSVIALYLKCFNAICTVKMHNNDFFNKNLAFEAKTKDADIKNIINTDTEKTVELISYRKQQKDE